MRDFTYVDDIVEGILRVMCCAPTNRAEDGSPSSVPHTVYNIGNCQPVKLLEFVQILKEELISAGILSADYDLDAHIELMPMQPGDVEATYADISQLEQDFGFRPVTQLRQGLHNFAQWYRDFFQIPRPE